MKHRSTSKHRRQRRSTKQHHTRYTSQHGSTTPRHRPHTSQHRYVAGKITHPLSDPDPTTDQAQDTEQHPFANTFQHFTATTTITTMTTSTTTTITTTASRPRDRRWCIHSTLANISSIWVREPDPNFITPAQHLHGHEHDDVELPSLSMGVQTRGCWVDSLTFGSYYTYYTAGIPFCHILWCYISILCFHNVDGLFVSQVWLRARKNLVVSLNPVCRQQPCHYTIQFDFPWIFILTKISLLVDFMFDSSLIWSQAISQFGV